MSAVVSLAAKTVGAATLHVWQDIPNPTAPYAAELFNCIVYFNTASSGANHYSSTLNFSCTTPLPSGGAGNITNAPVFVDRLGGNLRLQTNSPGINAGNNAYVQDSTDRDGRSRVAEGGHSAACRSGADPVLNGLKPAPRWVFRSIGIPSQGAVY